MIVDCISDLHGNYPQLVGGDLLIVAGDLTARHTEEEKLLFIDWLRKQSYQEKVFIAGNHDTFEENNKPHGRLYGNGVIYLLDWGTEFEGLKIWGSPWTKRFEGENPRCLAFTCETEEELAEHWEKIPDDVDILVTHSPACGVLDVIHREVFCGERDENVGSESLMKRISKINLKLNVFGHIHEGYGTMDMRWLKLKNGFKAGIYVNASHVNERYEPVNKPIRIEL